jgi:hypothetical protein
MAYIDESGIHDSTGELKGSSVGVVAGLVDYSESWADFCKDWQVVLTKYSAPYFHFCELSTASLVVRGKIKADRHFSKNPYAKWSLKTIDGFLYELAEIVGSGNKVIVGGWIETRNIHKAKMAGQVPPHLKAAADDPYAWLLHNFFTNVANDIVSGWPDWNELVSFFFDCNDDGKWVSWVAKAHHFAKKKETRFGELAFVNKKNPPHLPLQAADMISYRFRQLSENYHNNCLQYDPLPALDKFMMKSMFNQFQTRGFRNVNPL